MRLTVGALKRAYTEHGNEDAQIDLRAVVADCPHEEEGEACEDHDARDEELASHWFVPGGHGEWGFCLVVVEVVLVEVALVEVFLM